MHVGASCPIEPLAPCSPRPLQPSSTPDGPSRPTCCVCICASARTLHPECNSPNWLRSHAKKTQQQRERWCREVASGYATCVVPTAARHVHVMLLPPRGPQPFACLSFAFIAIGPEGPAATAAAPRAGVCCGPPAASDT